MRIHILQLLAVLALACIPLDSQKTYAAATAATPAFVFGGAGYLHRWSQNDQHEFTPEGQEDLDLLVRHTAASCLVRPLLGQRRRK